MLGKLLKYEIKATARWFLPLYAGILLFSIISRLFTFVKSNFYQNDSYFINELFDLMGSITIFLYVIVIIATFLLTFFLMIQRFYKNLLGDEGYLMFTIPVSPSKHIWTKLITSMVWFIASCIVTILSIFILISGLEFFNDLIQSIATFLRELTHYHTIRTILLFAEILITLLVSLANYNLMFYASISLGHTHKSHKILYSFAYLLLLNTVSQIFTSLVTIIAGMLFQNQFSSFLLKQIETLENSIPLELLDFIFTSSLIFTLITGVVYYLITNYALTKRLNLE